jgi:hypothetical protein
MVHLSVIRMDLAPPTVTHGPHTRFEPQVCGIQVAPSVVDESLTACQWDAGCWKPASLSTPACAAVAESGTDVQQAGAPILRPVDAKCVACQCKPEPPRRGRCGTCEFPLAVVMPAARMTAAADTERHAAPPKVRHSHPEAFAASVGCAASSAPCDMAKSAASARSTAANFAAAAAAAVRGTAAAEAEAARGARGAAAAARAVWTVTVEVAAPTSDAREKRAAMQPTRRRQDCATSAAELSQIWRLPRGGLCPALGRICPATSASGLASSATSAQLEA